MLKMPARLFISGPDGRLAGSCWPSPSLPLFIEQPRDTLNDTERGTEGAEEEGRGSISQKWNTVYFLRLVEKSVCFGGPVPQCHPHTFLEDMCPRGWMVFTVVCHLPMNSLAPQISCTCQTILKRRLDFFFPFFAFDPRQQFCDRVLRNPLRVSAQSAGV